MQQSWLLVEDLHEIQLRLDRVRQVPWRHRLPGFVECSDDSRVIAVAVVNPSETDDHLAVAEFVAHAPTDMADLLNEVHRLRAVLQHIAESQPSPVARLIPDILRDSAANSRDGELPIRRPDTAVER